jgi:hypothetical protein
MSPHSLLWILTFKANYLIVCSLSSIFFLFWFDSQITTKVLASQIMLHCYALAKLFRNFICCCFTFQGQRFYAVVTWRKWRTIIVPLMYRQIPSLLGCIIYSRAPPPSPASVFPKRAPSSATIKVPKDDPIVLLRHNKSRSVTRISCSC